jgi:hypothetical protein
MRGAAIAFGLLLCVGGSAVSWATEREPAPAPAPSAPKKGAATTRAASGPDLAVQLEAPEKAVVGQKLAGVRASVRNEGSAPSDNYRVEVELRGAPGASKRVADEPGKPLAPAGTRDHAFDRVALAADVAAGAYQLCARLTSKKDAVATNDESCRQLVVVAAGAAPPPAGRAGATPAPPAAVKPPATTRAPAAARPAPPPPPVPPPSPTAQSQRAAPPPPPSRAAAAERAPAAASPAMRATLDTRKRLYRDLAQRRQNAVARASAQGVLDEVRARAAEEAYAASRHGNDCDDSRVDVNPGVSEICDGIDNNCDGRVDEGQTLVAYSDADGDGHGDPATALDVCPEEFSRAQREGRWLSMTGNDCDDTDPDRWRDCD